MLSPQMKRTAIICDSMYQKERIDDRQECMLTLLSVGQGVIQRHRVVGLTL